MPLVSVIVPHLRGSDLLVACLNSLRAQTCQNLEVILVDNGSTDGSLELVRQRYQEVRVLALGENRGFAAACNRGVEAARGDLLWFLNDDARAATDCLDHLLQAARRFADAGSFAPRMLRATQPGVVDNRGIGFSVFGAGYQLGAGEDDDASVTEPYLVFGASGGAALYRRSVLETVGGFDEDFLSHNEDTDLAFRAQLAGYPCWHVPRAVVYHVGAATTPASSDETVYRVQRNMELTFWQNMPGALLVKYGLPHLAYSLAWLLYLALRGHGLAALRARADALAAWRTIGRKRRLRQMHRQVKARYVDSLLTWHLGVSVARRKGEFTGA